MGGAMPARVVDEGAVLPEWECRALLASRRVGRVALTVDALPAVAPVKYTVSGDSVLFYAPTHLWTGLVRTVVGLQVDDLDESPTGVRTVTALGVAVQATGPAQFGAARRAGIRPWRDGDRSPLIDLRVEILKGLRL